MKAKYLQEEKHENHEKALECVVGGHDDRR